MNGPEHLAERLQAVADDLDQLIFDRLREHDVRADKQLTQARRAVEKAIGLLRRADAAAGD